MTRKEQIGEAYQDYLGLGGVLHSNPWFAFKAGAEWADTYPNLESLWHDASEEPTKEPISILATDAKGFTDAYHFEKGGTIRIQRCRVNWAGAVLYFGLTKWAYIDDLLPKGGEK